MDATPVLFRALKQILWDFVAIQIAKLLERPGPGKKILSLERLIDDLNMKSTKEPLRQRLDALRQGAAAIRAYRDNEAAHTNLGVSVGGIKLSPVIRKTVDDTVAATANLLVDISHARGTAISSIDCGDYESAVALSAQAAVSAG